MTKENKLILSLAIGYAVVGFNTFGFKYHHGYGSTEEIQLDAGFAGAMWPLYWPARWSLLFWEPRPAPVTNTVYVTNYIERSNFGHMMLPNIPTNYWREYHYTPGDDVIRWTNNPSNPTNYTIPLTPGGTIRYMNGSNITIELAETNAYVHQR